MAKKRKAHSKSTPSRVDPDNSKLTINSFEDVADSEDEFLIHRDKILLDEGPEAKKRRKIIEDDQLLEASDEEVLAYPTSDEEDEALEDGNNGEEENGFFESADIELRGKASNLADVDVDVDEDEEMEGWGDSRQDYYGADVIDSEQAALEEEAEAKRLQQKHLASMADTDVYLGIGEDEGLDVGEGEGSDDDDHVVTEVLPELEISEDLSPEERLKLLKSRYPEFEPIAKDWMELHTLHEGMANEAGLAKQLLQRKQTMKLQNDGESLSTHTAIVKYTALSAYLGACAMYFAMLTSTANGTLGVLALAPRKLRDHPVIESILETRQLWQDVKDLPVSDLTSELAALEKATNAVPLLVPSTNQLRMKKNGVDKATKGFKKNKAELEAEAAQAAAAARRAERMRKVEEGLADLSALSIKSSRKSVKPETSIHTINNSDLDFGDETNLTKHELAEKAQRKKSLKFYTSQIAQKANKRGAAGLSGGDLDIPYRERLKDRQERLNAEAQRRGKKSLQPSEELGGESDEDDKRAARQLRAEADGNDEEDYYDMVVAKSKRKKAEKATAAAAYAQAEREGGLVREVEEVGKDGKRKISYMIEKNKGLTPHRKKEVRNPRVKKKLKYQQKMNKLTSTRGRKAYSGGEGRGGYGGELSGLKTDVVKSVKL